MTTTSRTPAGIAYDRGGPRGDLPVVLIHAGVADRRMWDPLWPRLTAERDVVRLDLRGFGESAVRPGGELCPVDDVLGTLATLGIGRCHLIGASFGAGVAVEVALTGPSRWPPCCSARQVDHSSPRSRPTWAIHDAARRVTDGIAGARRVDWPDTAHLPSMERPDDFLALLRDWLAPG